MRLQATSPGKRQGRGAKASQRGKSSSTSEGGARSTKVSLSEVMHALEEAKKEVQQGGEKLRADMNRHMDASNKQQEQIRKDMQAADADDKKTSKRMESRLDKMLKLMGVDADPEAEV